MRARSGNVMGSHPTEVLWVMMGLTDTFYLLCVENYGHFSQCSGVCTSTLCLAVSLVPHPEAPKATNCPRSKFCHHFRVETTHEFFRSLYVLVLLLPSLLCLQTTTFHLCSSRSWALVCPLSNFGCSLFLTSLSPLHTDTWAQPCTIPGEICIRYQGKFLHREG